MKPAQRDLRTLPSSLGSPQAVKFGMKRTRIEKACNNCRAIRRKCNALSPCNNCETAGTICSYEDRPVPTERLTLAKAVKRIAYLEERLRLYEGLAGDNDQVSHLYDTNVFSTQRTKQKPDDDMSRALQGISRLNLTPRLPEFYGGSSCNVVIEAVEDLAEGKSVGDVAVSSPEDRAFVWLNESSELLFSKAAGGLLPPKARSEIRSFLNSMEHWWSGLPTEGRGYELWSAVMYMVVALGHQYCLIGPEKSIRDQAIAFSQDGEACYQLFKSLLGDASFAGGDMSTVNSTLLAFMWLYNQQRLHEAYLLLGLAVRVSYSIGLHRSARMDSGSSAHVLGWCASFWSLFTYEREIAALLGRPSAVQPREVDIKPFAVESSPTDLQYLERMRQFSYVTWEVYDQVYSLAFKHASLDERVHAVRKADQSFEAWFHGWYEECTWAKEPHGLVCRLRFTHTKLLHYRAFLNLLTHKSREREQTTTDLLDMATECVLVACRLVQLVVDLAHVGSRVSGTLQGVMYHALGYLWGAAATLMLYESSSQTKLVLQSRLESRDALRGIDTALSVFLAYEAAIPFAATVAQRVTSFLSTRNADNAMPTPWTTAEERVAMETFESEAASQPHPEVSNESLLDVAFTPEGGVSELMAFEGSAFDCNDWDQELFDSSSLFDFFKASID